jgi:hypothetical protein
MTARDHTIGLVNTTITEDLQMMTASGWVGRAIRNEAGGWEALEAQILSGRVND